jgi:hypothetical protein
MVIGARIGELSRVALSQSRVVVGLLGPSFIIRLQRLVDDHGKLNMAAEVAGEQALDIRAETVLQLVAGEDIGHGDHQHVLVKRNRLAGCQPAPQARRRGGVEMLPGQVGRFGGAL